MIVQATGTLTPGAIGTEYTLADLMGALTYVGTVYLSAMIAGDTVALNIYVATIASATPKSCYYQVFQGVQPQGSIVAISLPVPSPFEWKWTLNQTAGVARAFPYTAISL